MLISNAIYLDHKQVKSTRQSLKLSGFRARWVKQDMLIKVIENGSLWYLLKDNKSYYISQLSGYMHSETTATYRLLSEEVDSYLKFGNKALSRTINYFSNIGNYSALPNERMVSRDTIDKIRAVIDQKIR